MWSLTFPPSIGESPMPITQHTDSNGWVYNAVTTAEWYSSYGDTLRAEGWRYCGYGTWGIYITKGADCATRAISSSEPQILPPSPDAPTPQPRMITDTACSGCRPVAPPQIVKPAPTTTPTIPAAGMPTTPRAQYPWWVFVLVALTLAQVIYGRNN